MIVIIGSIIGIIAIALLLPVFRIFFDYRPLSHLYNWQPDLINLKLII